MVLRSGFAGLENKGYHAFEAVAAKLWNSIPLDLETLHAAQDVPLCEFPIFDVYICSIVTLISSVKHFVTSLLLKVAI